MWKYKTPEKGSYAKGSTLETLPTSKQCKEIVSKTSYHHKNNHKDHWNKVPNNKISPYIWSQLTYNKGIRNIHWSKDCLFSTWHMEINRLEKK